VGKTRIDEQTEAVRALARVSRLLERSSAGLSLPHYRVLAAIAEGHERASRVAHRLALGKPTVSASVEALSRRGLIVREDVTGDQRATTLRVTSEGERVLREAESAMCERLSTLLSHTDAPAETTRTLAGLSDALDRMTGERSEIR
jgi:DNA-binding MarR family transcriptional regulator